MVTETKINLEDEELFDDTAGYDEDRGITLASGLTERERKQASALYHLFNELMGLCIIRGNVGSGKDTFLNWLLFTCKRFFPSKRILRDEKPRRLFGRYDGIFNAEVIHEDLSKMREIARGARKEAGGQRYDGNYMYALEKAADEWVTDRGVVLLQNSVVGCTEYHKYVYNREPHNPMNKTMGSINKVKRHINTLIAGCVQLESDLDKKTCKPFVDWRVTCTRSRKDTTRYVFIVEKVKYDSRLDLLTPIGRPFLIPVDAGKPRSYIGDGIIEIRKHNYRPETLEEEIVLDVLKAGVTKYEELVEFLVNEGDMAEAEILAVVKELSLKLPGKRMKGVIWYPCIYRIFNSRSAPNLHTKIRIGD